MSLISFSFSFRRPFSALIGTWMRLALRKHLKWTTWQSSSAVDRMSTCEPLCKPPETPCTTLSLQILYKSSTKSTVSDKVANFAERLDLFGKHVVQTKDLDHSVGLSGRRTSFQMHYSMNTKEVGGLFGAEFKFWANKNWFTTTKLVWAEKWSNCRTL